MDRKMLQLLIEYFDAAERAIYNAIIAPITRSSPGPIPARIPDLILNQASSNEHLLGKTVLQSVDHVTQSSDNIRHEILVTMIAGKLKRWHHSGRWVAYSMVPGDILKVWNPNQSDREYINGNPN